ncbi:uncharacterized protein Dere_GG18376 [Drosophila erecta]|uniref:U2A'/phosphoprotein 32 family A C-terminal domain-containing protein n=2 Tax=Drosophila erecta TaxID=7220 RepID=B3NVC9_DROER|nr:uncharacterized protein Dere_GG18376 [Drosophila erecta]
MTNRLTEQLVETKAKCSDYRKAVRLNAWGNDLVDITICLRMPLLEVLALSLNKINTLSSLVNCTRLKELYLRKNDITSFDELNHLSNARSLISLWLENNPCSDAAGADYRACVLRKLPNLKKLDNVDVSDLEVQAALRHEYYPEQKSAIVAPVAETSLKPGCSPKVKACLDRIEKERERVREKEEHERELEQRERQGCENYDDMQLPRPNRFAGGDARDVREKFRIRSPSPQGRRKIPSEKMSRCMQPNPHPVPKDQHDQQPVQPAQSVQQVQQRQQNPPGHRVANASAAAMLIAQNHMERISPSPPMPAAYSTTCASLEKRRSHNSNLFTAALCLIREMDTSQLKALVLAIHEQLANHPTSY